MRARMRYMTIYMVVVFVPARMINEINAKPVTARVHAKSMFINCLSTDKYLVY